MAVLSSEDRAFWEENGYVVIHNAAPLETHPECRRSRLELS